MFDQVAISRVGMEEMPSSQSRLVSNLVYNVTIRGTKHVYSTIGVGGEELGGL